MTKDENVVDLELSYDFLVLNMKQYNKIKGDLNKKGMI